jgi:hypothetical protein
MKTVAVLTLASAVFARCDIILQGTRKVNRLFRSTIDEKTFSEFIQGFPIGKEYTYEFPELRTTDQFHYSVSPGCGQCLMTVSNFGGLGISQKFAPKSGEPKSIEIKNRLVKFPNFTRFYVYIKCGTTDQAN